jgi:hypothetical protein
MCHRFSWQLSLMLLPLGLSGCCTYITIDASRHAFLHDSVQRIQKAGITDDNKLVILVDGAKAESLRIRPYTIAVTLPTNADVVQVPQDGMTNGWNAEAFNRKDTLPVTVGPSIVLPAYEAISYNEERFPTIAKADRTLYLVPHLNPDQETSLFYTENGEHPRKIEIIPDGREVRTPWRYPFLLLVPFSLALDAVTWPCQIYVVYTWGHARPVSVTPIKAETPVEQQNVQ